MIVCVLLPRFPLAVAARARHELLGEPLALSPEPGREPRVGEVSAAAEAFGVRAGMLLGEALTRCPQLRLVAADPVAVEAAWEEVLRSLESIGAGVETERPGLACFAADGLRRLHGGRLEDVLAATRRALDRPARLGAGPTRFAALAAATRARARRPEVVPGATARAARAYLAGLPVSLLGSRERTAALVEPLERLGVRTLGELAAWTPAAAADRFGAAGMIAHALARGLDDPPRPRRVAERLEESLELPEAAAGPQLERALGLLVDRVLARPERRGRRLRAAVLAATLVEGGTWRERVTFREALGDPARLRLALVPRLAALPAPAEALSLAIEGLGSASGEQRPLIDEPAAARDARLREAVRQVRAAAGSRAALRVLAVDPDSRVPERRMALTPFEP